MSEKILESIDKKMSTLLKLLALNAVTDKSLNEQITLLHNAGMTPAEIAKILNKTSNHIRVALHTIKKNQKETSNNLEANND